MHRPAAALCALVLAAAFFSTAAHAGKHRHRAGRTPDKKNADSAGGSAATISSSRQAAGTALLRQIQPQLDDLRACYTRERAKNPRLAAAEVIVHAIVDASGKIIESVPYGVKSRPDSFAVIQRDVAHCLSKRVGTLSLGPFPDGMARKIVVAFRFGSDPPSGPQPLDGTSMEQVHLALSVVSGQSVGFARSISQLSHRFCWKVDSDREGCSLRVLNLFPTMRVKKEVPIYKPGEALTDSDRSRLETRVLRDLTGDDTFRWPPGTELFPIEWPDDAAAVVLPDVGLALSASAGHIDVGQATADGEEILSPRLDLPGGRAAHLVAVYWAPTVPVVALGLRRPADPKLGDPAQSTRATDVQVIRLGK